MTRKDKKTYLNDRSEDQFTIETVLEIWGTNSTLSDKNAKLEVATFDLHSDWTDKWSKDVVLSQNSSTELYKGALSGLPIRTKKSETPKVLIVSARLIDKNGDILGRYSNWCVLGPANMPYS
jgi:beta-mannosidase